MFEEAKIKKFERTIGGLKFAVILIVLFSIAMIVGTFLESYYGTDFANRAIYKTFPFMLIQAGMFLSIIFAAFLRLPPKKRLYGFYTIHSGLVMIGLGSLITYVAGIDGTVFLPPNQPVRKVTLSDDILKIYYDNEQKYLTYNLPYVAFEKNIGAKTDEFKIGRYYPFADKKFVWKKPVRSYKESVATHTSNYFLYNPNVSQEFKLSLHPEQNEFETSLKLGPLSINYLPEGLYQCFQKASGPGFILWNGIDGKCQTVEDMGIKVVNTKSGKTFFAFRDGEKTLTFFPNFSPWPLDKEMNPITSSNWRTFSRVLFEKSPTLFLFGKSLAYFDKDENKWVGKEFKGNESVELPWMGFQIQLTDHSTDQVPAFEPISVMPIQKNNELIKGNMRAIEIIAKNKSFWVTDTKPLSLLIDGKKLTFVLQKETLMLPFEFVLTKFKMDKDPGTNNPASYESFVTLFSKEGPKDTHIYMNNPLKHEGFTFYQASYSQDRNGNYSSTLSANVDQGRPLKYLGSLLLVLGAIWHYMLNRKKAKPRDHDLITTNEATV